MAGLPIAVGVGDPSGHAILLIQSHYSHPVRGAPAALNQHKHAWREPGETDQPHRPTDRPTEGEGHRGRPANLQQYRPPGYWSRLAPRAVTGCIPRSGEVIKYGH